MAGVGFLKFQAHGHPCRADLGHNKQAIRFSFVVRKDGLHSIFYKKPPRRVRTEGEGCADLGVPRWSTPRLVNAHLYGILGTSLDASVPRDPMRGYLASSWWRNVWRWC